MVTRRASAGALGDMVDGGSFAFMNGQLVFFIRKIECPEDILF